MRKIISLVLSFGLVFQQVSFAQVAAELNIVNYLSKINSNIIQDKFRPLHLRYFSYDSLNDNFKLLLDKGDLKKLEDSIAQEATKTLLSYFLVGLSLPDSMFWVNLKPDSEDQIIDPYMEKTDVGKIMLEADLQLKKDTALYTSPQTPEGKKYWNRLYKKAAEIFGNENIEIPTLTRPWIVPGEIIIRESKDSAYVYKATLKVMLEQDYLKGSATYNFKDERSKALNEYSSQLIRELIIPKLTKEVNSSKRYAALRQVYYSLILSRWFKLRFTGKSGTYSHLINTRNLTNLISREAWSKTDYFKQYQKSFRDGEYNIKEPVYTPTGQVIRSYFSGGINVANGAINTQNGFSSGKVFSPAFLDKAGVLMEGNSVGGIKTSAVSPIKTSDEKSASSALTQEEALTKLNEEIFEGQLRSLYGKDKVEAASINPYLAKIGFDYDDKKEPNRLGWTIANLEWILQNSEKVQSLLDDAQIIRDNFKYVIFCGMGGSGLSVQVVKDTFAEKKVKIYSLRTTDPQIIRDILNEIASLEGSLEAALGRTLVIPISKSGTTQETVSHKQYFERLFKKFLIDVKKHLWVVTDKGSPMDTGDYIQREIQLNGKGDIGGRFTAPTTNVFLLPLAIVAPERVMDILRITKEMNEIKDIKQDIFLKLGAYLYYMAAGQGKDKITMFMPEELKDIPLWAEQLFEESLGKDGKGVTLFYGEKLSPKEFKAVGQNDRVFLRINIGGRNTRQELWDYLVKNNYPVFEIDVKNINSIGGIMLGLQRTVASIAYLWDIVFVNQPAVQGYKYATNQVYKPGKEVDVPSSWNYASYNKLKLYYTPLIEAKIISEEMLQQEVYRLGYSMDNAPAVYAAILSILNSRGNFEAKELISYGRMTPGLRDILEDTRYNIFTGGLKIPAKLGEGPDKNHSYHQNIEGGKNMWFSTYFMAKEIGQPEALGFDANLLKGQAIGTVQSLTTAGRSVALITFDTTIEAAEQDTKEFFAQVSEILTPNLPAASSAVQLVDRVEIVSITNKNIKSKYWETAGCRGDKTDPDDFSIDNVSRQVAGFAEEVLERISIGKYTPINGKTVRVAFAFDSRKDSDEYAYEMAKVLTAYKGFEVEILDEALPTPVVARLTQKKRPQAYDFAFHVTPSHNQLQYGGIKLLFEGSVNEHIWTYFFEKRANAKMEYPVNPNAQLKRVQVIDQLTEEYLQDIFPGLIEKFASFKQLNPDAQFTIDLMDGSMASFAHLFERLGVIVVRSGRMKDINYFGKKYILADGKEVGFAPDPTQSVFYKDEPAYQKFLKSAPEGSIYFIIDGDGDRLVTIVKKEGKLNSIKPNQFGPLAADYIFTNHLLPEVNQIVRTYVTSAGMDAVARYHGLPAPVIVPVGSKYFNRFVPHAIALEESGHFVAGSFFDDTIYQAGMILSMISESNKDVFTLLAETQERTGYKGIDRRDDFENLSAEVKAKFIEPLTGTPEEVRVKSQNTVNEIVAQSGKELLEALVVVEGEYGIGRVVKLKEYVDSLFTNESLVIESSNKGIIVRFTDLSWGGARLSGTGNTGRLYTEGRESDEERQKIADAFKNTLDLPRASSAVQGEKSSDIEVSFDIALEALNDTVHNRISGSPVAPPMRNNVPVGAIDASTSSALILDNGMGGIDFRALPMAIQPMGSFTTLNFKLPQLSRVELEQINIDSEMQQIRNVVQSGIIPSGQRIKEFIAACVQKGQINSQIDNLLLCLAETFKLEEENASESSPELREALVIVDSQG